MKVVKEKVGQIFHFLLGSSRHCTATIAKVAFFYATCYWTLLLMSLFVLSLTLQLDAHIVVIISYIILLHRGFDKLELGGTRKVTLDKSDTDTETDTCILKFSLCCMFFFTTCNSGYLVSGLHHGWTTYWTDTLPGDGPYPSTTSPLLLQCTSKMPPSSRFSIDLGQVMDGCTFFFSVYIWCTLTYDCTRECSLHSEL